MKKTLSLLLTCLLLPALLTGCGVSPAQAPAEPGTLRVLTTIYPACDWVERILGDDGPGEVSMLVDTGVDLHSYQPTVDDIVKIADCDLFIYVGGESDVWVTDALKESSNPDRVVLSLMDLLGDGVKEEETVEGMEPEAREDHDPEYDEHVWLSLKNARVLCAAIADALSALDPEGADRYAANLAAYDGELAALDEAYAALVDGAPHHTLLFGDRFPFRYLADDYGLDYYAAFPGCSAETEASFETIVFLAGKLDELGLPAVLTIEGADHRIAETIVESSRTGGQAILALDSMQSVTAADVAGGADYLSRMRKNLDVLAQALGA